MKARNTILFTMAAALGLFLLPSLAWSAPTAYKVDGGHSAVLFKIRHLGIGNFYGRFNKVSGSIKWGKPKQSSLDIKVRSASVDTGIAKRDKHLRSPDFFNAKQFPLIRFKSKTIRKAGKGKYRVVGLLTLNGKTRKESVVFRLIGKGKDPWGNTRVGAEATFTINRFAYGIGYMPKGLGKDVTLIVSLEGIKKK